MLCIAIMVIVIVVDKVFHVPVLNKLKELAEEAVVWIKSKIE